MPTETAVHGSLVKELGLPLYQSKGWMKLIGVLSIVWGVVVALSVIGLVIAWLPIWMGVVLYQSASAAEEAVRGGSQEALARSLRRIKTYFTIMGVITLIALVLTVLGFFMGMFGAWMGMGPLLR
jgi:hypothetical protein